MTSKIAIANLALDQIGHTTTIASFEEQSKEATTCARHYDQCRQEVLQAHPWGFARKHIRLAPKDEDDNTPPPGWAYAYAYPSDCLKAHAVVDESGLRTFMRSFAQNPVRESVAQMLRNPFQTMAAHDLNSKLIVTDLEDAILAYTADVTNTNLFAPLFVTALYYRVAAAIAMPMTSDPDIAKSAYQMYLAKVVEAKAHDLEEVGEDPQPESPSILARTS